MITDKQIKRRSKLDYWAKRASNCRHENYQVSCCSCSQKATCDIQMNYIKWLNY